MNDYITNYCSICKIEEANCFCKICSLWYCWEHHCHHLTVAHESNSYSIRLDEDFNNEDQNIRTCDDNESELYLSPDLENQVNKEPHPIPPNVLPLGTYSEAELQKQYDFHRNQARRIRNELERRALFASGVVAKDWWMETLPRRERKLQRHSSSNLGISKSSKKSIEILLNHIRLGAISAEQVKAQIQAARSKN